MDFNLTHKFLVSFSLYGNAPKYTGGALVNAEQIRSFGSDWAAVFYVGADVNPEITGELVKLGGIVKKEKPSWHRNGMFWRYQAIFDFDFDYLLFRDTDSRIELRELGMIQDWVKSNRMLHVIRDHPNHNALILGGLWGTTHHIRTVQIPWEMAGRFGTKFGQDQDFLADYVYFAAGKSKFITDSFYSFKSLLGGTESKLPESYMGESLDEFNKADQNLREVRLRLHLNSIRHFFKFIKFHLIRIQAWVKYFIRINLR